MLFAAALVLTVLFVFYERAEAHPILDVSFFKRSAFAGANAVAFCTYFGTFSIFFFVALYLQDVGTSSGYATALDFVPMAAAMIIASLFAGRWVAPVGPRLPMTVGCVLAGIGIILTEVVLTPNSGLSTLGLDAPDSRCRLRDRDRACDLHGLVRTSAATLRHGGVRHQHQP